MEQLNSKQFSKGNNLKYGVTYSIESPLSYKKSYNDTFQRGNLNTAFTTNNNNNLTNNNISSFERYKNQQLLNKAKIPSFPFNDKVQNSSTITQRCNHCHSHRFHIHHIHLPRRHLYDILNIENLAELKNIEKSFDSQNILLKEVTELRNECRKFKEELDKKNNDNNYAEQNNNNLNNMNNEGNFNNTANNAPNDNMNNNNLQKDNNNYNFMDENEKNKNMNRYYDMLDKSFGVLNSVSNKCDDIKGKMKGGINYYLFKDPDYNELIQAQKNWVNKLPENIGTQSYLNNNPNMSYNNNDSQNNPQRNQNSNNNKFNMKRLPLAQNPNQNKLRYNMDNDLSDEGSYNRNRNHFDSKRNNNKGYIIKRGEKINNKNGFSDMNNNEGINSGLNNDNNYNYKMPSDDNRFNNNDYYNRQINPNSQVLGIDDIINMNNINNNSSNDIKNSNNNSNNKSIPKNSTADSNNLDNKNLKNYKDNDKEKEKEKMSSNLDNSNDKIRNKIQPQLNNEDKNNLNNNLNDNDNANSNENEIENEEEEDEQDLLNDRFLIVDENGNPITINGQKLLGMELIPLIGEDGKEVIDNNGNIVLIGPDGQPKTQDELEPIILDDGRPLVNEENKPFLGLCGVPLINGEGSPILGPSELYDKDNKIVRGSLGFVAKDNMGNPIKVKINGNQKEGDNDNNNDPNDNNRNNSGTKNKISGKGSNNNLSNNDNNNNNDLNNQNNEGNMHINIEESTNEDNTEDMNNYNKLRPLIGADGIPIKDSYNNHIILDENNKPIKNSGISVLLDQTGKPVLNNLGLPILIDAEGKPLNSNGQNPYYNNKELPNNNKNKGSHPYERIKGNRPIVAFNNNIPERDVPRSKRDKAHINYSDCNSESLKKINFMRPYKDPHYDDNEYKLSCFACEVGCSVSKSGYSPMNFSPYNNLIRRRDITPLGTKKLKRKKSKKNSNNVNLKKINMENENNYYLTEGQNAF